MLAGTLSGACWACNWVGVAEWLPRHHGQGSHQILRGMLDAALLGKGFDIVWLAANNGHYISTGLARASGCFRPKAPAAPATHVFILRPLK